MTDDRIRRTLVVTSGAAIAAAIVTALRRRPWGSGGRRRGDGPDATGVREPRVPSPTGGAAAAEAEPPAA